MTKRPLSRGAVRSSTAGEGPVAGWLAHAVSSSPAPAAESALIPRLHNLPYSQVELPRGRSKGSPEMRSGDGD